MRTIGTALVLAAAALALPGTPAQADPLVTLYSTMEGPETVQGINSASVGPYQRLTYRTATAFTPAVTGNAQLLRVHGQCVINYPVTTTCETIGTVEIQSDASGHPSGTVLGT